MYTFFDIDKHISATHRNKCCISFLSPLNSGVLSWIFAFPQTTVSLRQSADYDLVTATGVTNFVVSLMKFIWVAQNIYMQKNEEKRTPAVIGIMCSTHAFRDNYTMFFSFHSLKLFCRSSLNQNLLVIKRVLWNLESLLFWETRWSLLKD